MDGWWPCAPGNVTVMHRARPTALSWRIPGYAHAGVRRSWGKCAIAFPSPTASASKGPAGLTLEPFSWMDHLIRPPQQRRRNRQAERLRGLEVDDEVELRGLLDGKITRFGAFQDLVHVGRSASKQISNVRSIRHKAPGIDIVPLHIRCRQPVLCRQVHEASSLIGEHDGSQDSQSARARPGHFREGPVEIGGTSRLNALNLPPQHPPRDFCSLQHVFFRAFAVGTWLPEDSDPIDSRDTQLELFQTLADELREDEGQPRDIAARPRKAGDEAAPNRIGSSSEDNGEGAGCLLGSPGSLCASSGHDDINLEGNQFGRKSGKALRLPLGISVFDHDVAALDVTEVTQSLEEGLVSMGASGPVERQIAYASDLGGLLRLGGERRGEQAASQTSEECPAIHYWIPSSARPSSDCGIVSPSALAVLRLMTSSNFEGSSMGKLAGLAPLRIRST